MAARNPPLWLQAGSHPATNDRLLLEALMAPPPAVVSGAGYGIVGPSDLAVTQNGTPNMSVNVAAGKAFVDGTENANQGAYLCVNDATVNLAIAASDPTNPRKDLVVAKVQDAEWSGATNSWSLAVVTGTPAASPSEPAVPANAHVLAMINVAAGATSITNGNITDRRRRASALGGIVVCTSSTRPASPTIHQFIFETDTGYLMRWDGSSWTAVTPTGWADYTPSHSGLTVGNGSQLARWARVGRIVHVLYRLSFGSTTAITGNVEIGLPVASTSSEQAFGSGVILDSGTRWFTCGAHIGGSASRAAVVHTESGNAGIVNASNPMTWTTSDLLALNLMYEAAA